MHVFLQVLLIGVASNLDNLAVGVAYGIRRISVLVLPNLVIAAFAFVFSCVGGTAGTQLGCYLHPRTASVLGGIIIIGIGIWLLPLRKQPKMEPTPSGNKWRTAIFILTSILRDPELADHDHSHDISFRESLLLGVALSLNCLTNSFPAGLWTLNVWSVATCNAVLSFITLWTGMWLGKRYGADWLGRKADVVAGIILVSLGLHGAIFG
jgi:putative sporulation protein YtaF